MCRSGVGRCILGRCPQSSRPSSVGPGTSAVSAEAPDACRGWAGSRAWAPVQAAASARVQPAKALAASPKIKTVPRASSTYVPFQGGPTERRFRNHRGWSMRHDQHMTDLSAGQPAGRPPSLARSLGAVGGVVTCVASLVLAFALAWQQGWLWWSLSIALAFAPLVVGLLGLRRSSRSASGRRVTEFRAVSWGLLATWMVVLVLVLAGELYNFTLAGN